MKKGDKVRLNHELLLWRGFTLSNGVWSYPNGETVDNGVPYFPEDETACFKWLVPKLPRWAMGSYGDGTTYAIVTIGDKRNIPEINHERPALALCLAIQELIRSKNES